jgi:hypothetical protein
MAERFTIKIPCKPYVKVFLEINGGDPVDLHHLPVLFKEFRRGLSKKPEHREKACVAVYSDSVTIIIPSDMFYRHGWELNKENLLDFNRVAEQQVKYFMRQYISFNNSMGVSVANSIREFQDKFGFTESIWNYEAIKKDFDRNGQITQMKTIKKLREEVIKILLDNLSDIGTVSKKLQKEYINL